MASDLPHGSQLFDYQDDQRRADMADDLDDEDLDEQDWYERRAEAAQDRGMERAKEE